MHAENQDCKSSGASWPIVGECRLQRRPLSIFSARMETTFLHVPQFAPLWRSIACARNTVRGEQPSLVSAWPAVFSPPSLSSRNSMRVISMAPRSILRSLGGCEGSCLGVTKHWGYVCRSNQASGARHTYVYALLTPGTRLMEFAIRMCTIATATQQNAHA